MRIVEASNPTKHFRKNPWLLQYTFVTPSKTLSPFVTTIFDAHRNIEKATVTIEQIVFRPKELTKLAEGHSITTPISCANAIEAEDSAEAPELLEAALKDSIDFWFIPTPKPFAIYADHDEYVTFFANKKSNLADLIAAFLSGGYKQVSDFDRKF